MVGLITNIAFSTRFGCSQPLALFQITQLFMRPRILNRASMGKRPANRNVLRYVRILDQWVLWWMLLARVEA